MKLSSRRPIAIDLFAGVGGLSLGFEQAGFDIVTSVEYDPVHAAVHAFNFPRTEILCADISTLSVERLREGIARGCAMHGSFDPEWAGEIDVVFGGPPCQGFSTMGKRLIDDKRNQLVFHFFRLIAGLRPRYFVMENVPGMQAGGHSSILAKLVKEFAEAGYQVVMPTRILNAADYGVPQDRQRLILLGAREGESLPSYPMPTVRPVAKRAPKSELQGELQFGAGALDAPLKGPTVWDALGDLPDLDLFEQLWKADEICLPDGLLTEMEARASSYVRRLRGLEDDPSDLSYPRMWERHLLTSSLRTAHTELSVNRFKATKSGDTEPVSRFYRLDPQGLSNTLRAGTGSERGAYTSPRPIHPVLPRVISVREAARLHSFPDWFRLHTTKWHGFRQIGNAVPPLLGRAIGAEIVVALHVAPQKPQLPISLGDRAMLTLNMSEAADRFGAKKEAIPAPRQRIASRAVEVAK